MKILLLIPLLLAGCVHGHYQQTADGGASFKYMALFHKATFKGLNINSGKDKIGFKISEGTGMGDPETILAMGQLIKQLSEALAKSSIKQ